ncbi:hypothetical protein [Candidatus Methylacidiphilum infernorum]|uniref:Septum formation initiator n=1 Tax=Methylacidiphilum infernorum (isolate V4) TaxID=481448 RepID=B3DVW9_METI4|nr:hypothetical protein [Candidatus Methylacidiphilum infernorum]ACD83472.1 Hypothetical protein Minf_1418 [Methylacidiphilum infernorum V4]
MKNRIKGRHSVKLTVMFTWIMTLFIMMLGGVEFLYLKNRVLRLSEEMKLQEEELADIKRKNGRLEAMFAKGSSPQELENRLKEWKIGLVKISELEVIMMEETPSLDFFAGNE